MTKVFVYFILIFLYLIIKIFWDEVRTNLLYFSNIIYIVLRKIINFDLNSLFFINLEFKNDYNNEYQLKINKFDPQKKIIKNNWEKRLLSRINSYIITNINNWFIL